MICRFGLSETLHISVEGIKVLLMNAGLDKPKEGNKAVCQRALSNIVREHTPQLVILQEFSPTDEYWKTRVKDEYNETAIVAGNVNMYKKNCLSLIYLKSEIKLSTAIEEYGSSKISNNDRTIFSV